MSEEMATTARQPASTHENRDKSRDIPVTINGATMAIVYAGSRHPVVQWQVYGPQDLDIAYEICKGVCAAIEQLRGIAPTESSAKPARPASKVFRELIAQGLTDDEIWAEAKAELGLPDSSKYRVKEYRREMEKAQESPSREA
jgi:hypothetical protein